VVPPGQEGLRRPSRGLNSAAGDPARRRGPPNGSLSEGASARTAVRNRGCAPSAHSESPAGVSETRALAQSRSEQARWLRESADRGSGLARAVRGSRLAFPGRGRLG
jgi:hypothetical protein